MPRVRIRTLTDEERILLQVKLRDKTLSVRVWERYRIVSELSEGRSSADVADRVGCHLAVVAPHHDLEDAIAVQVGADRRGVDAAFVGITRSGKGFVQQIEPTVPHVDVVEGPHQLPLSRAEVMDDRRAEPGGSRPLDLLEQLRGRDRGPRLTGGGCQQKNR